MSEIADRILGITTANTVNTTVFKMISNMSLYDETMLFKRNQRENYVAGFHIYFSNIGIGTLTLPIFRCSV